jgi:hypothetical protein
MSFTITAAELIAEGERLSRPCLLLGSWGQGNILGYWGGKGREPRPTGHMMELPGVVSKHWVSIDCDWLAQQGILHPQAGNSYLSIYERKLPEDHPLYPYRGHDFIWVGDGVPLAKAGMDGEPLYAKEAVSFPPFQAVCMYGGPAVEAWMASFGLRRIDYEHSNLHRSEAGRAYYREWERRTPWAWSGDEGTAAVLGGWHQMWPDDDFYVPPETQPVLWTLRDSEPWIEIRRGFRNYLVFSRIT